MTKGKYTVTLYLENIPADWDLDNMVQYGSFEDIRKFLHEFEVVKND